MAERKCCYLEGGTADGKTCAANAEFELYGADHPNGPTDTCAKHIGDLMDDSQETRIFRIPASW